MTPRPATQEKMEPSPGRARQASAGLRSAHTVVGLAPGATFLWGGWLAGASNVGKDWGVEAVSYHDRVTGVRVCELTSGSNNTADNLYFHFSNFTADNRHLIFVSDRTGSRQIFRAEVESKRLVQLTDDPSVSASTACPDHTQARRLYYLRGAEIIALDIIDFAARRVGEIPPPHVGGFQQPTLSGDGQWLTVGKQRDAANWEVGLIHTQTGEYRTVLTQGFRVGHIQHSPTDPLIFYVWETGGYAPQRT